MKEGRWTPMQCDGGSRVGTCGTLGIAASLVIAAGTGGAISHTQAAQLMGTGAFVHNELNRRSAPSESSLSRAIRTVRDVLRLSVSELATIFAVSRPTIYSWQAGGACTPEHEARVQSLVAALEPYSELLERQHGRTAHRAIDGNRSYLQVLSSGEPVEVATERLVAVLERETQQRMRLASRLSPMSKRHGTADVDTWF